MQFEDVDRVRAATNTDAFQCMQQFGIFEDLAEFQRRGVDRRQQRLFERQTASYGGWYCHPRAFASE